MSIKTIKKTLQIIFTSMIVSFIICALIINKDNVKICFDASSNNKFNKGWKFYNFEKNEYVIVDLPYFFTNENRLLILEKKIPVLKIDSIIVFRINSYEKIKVYANGRILFSSSLPPSVFKRSISSEYISIPLDKSFSGKDIKLEILCGYNDKSSKTLQNVYLGEKASIYFDLFKDNIETSITIFFGIICSLFLVILHFTFESPIIKIKNELAGINYSSNRILNKILMHIRAESHGNILITASIPLTSSIWLAGESSLFQIWIGNPYIITSIEYFSAMLLPALLFFSISRMYNYKYQTISKIFVLLYLLCIFFIIILQAFKISEFHLLVLVYYIPAVVFTSIQFLLMVLDFYKSKERIILPFLITLIILSIVIIINTFFNFTTQQFAAQIISISFFVYMIIIFYILVLEFLKMVNKGHMLTYYEQMAFNDCLTGLKNDIEYNIKTETLSKYESKSFAFVVLDINNLKTINDRFGHNYGDIAIKKCAEKIIKAFDSAESSYRIGGDEFVCILYGLSEEIIEERICLFKTLCGQTPIFDNYFLEVAIGYAVYDSSKDPHPLNAFKRADAYMYENKNKTKTIKT